MKIGVRFDEQKAFNLGYSNPSDYSSENIFINNPKKFITGLKTAKHTIIQSEFYDEGVKTIEFNSAGLIWQH